MRKGTLDLRAVLKEYRALKNELFGKEMFVEADFSNPKWVRYNELVYKLGAF